MATLDSLKRTLRQTAEEGTSPLKQALSDAQYGAGLDILKQGAGWLNYEDFIIPHTSQLLGRLFDSRTDVSVLEIGPGPKSLFNYLPRHLRDKIRTYKAFEPNSLFAARLEESLGPKPVGDSTLPHLTSPPDICRQPFEAKEERTSRYRTTNSSYDSDQKYDAIIFCHSMYGIKPKRTAIERALRMLTGSPDHLDEGGLVLAFHRDNRALHFGDLACYQTASFPTGVVRVTDSDEDLDLFASFVAGFVVQAGTGVGNTIRNVWRKACRNLGRREEAHPGHLLFSAPEIMFAFSFCANWLRELTDMVPLAETHRTVENRGALLHHPVPVVQPKDIYDVQFAVRWALECGLGLNVLGGGHSGHCLWPNVVSVDMSAFNHVHIVKEEQDQEEPRSTYLVVAEAGCTTEEIIRRTMKEGLTIPLGSRPSVGAGMWLQGGIGHLARLYGLACDSIVGAVIVSVRDYNHIFCIGNVPTENQPHGATFLKDELWAIKGAGTNLGIVISVTFRAHEAPTYRTQNWVVELRDSFDAHKNLKEFGEIATEKLPRNTSADAYLYWENGQLRLGVTIFDSSTESIASGFEAASFMFDSIWGPGDSAKAMDGVELFDAEMYLSGMHGGHGGGKTSSFKRCVFLRHVGKGEVAGRLVSAMKNRPTPLCYLHLLQGGGAVGDVPVRNTAFGCRDWHFACVINGVWPRDQDASNTARSATQWVYDVAGDLLALDDCGGAYGADLGPDPRDSVLATKAFGPNRSFLAYAKREMDPWNILAYTCPLPKTSLGQKIIILVTGESCAGKDFCADVWLSVLTSPDITQYQQVTARVVSISSVTKGQYAEATGAELSRLLWDRAYKEQHRPALTAYFRDQMRERPNLPEKQFLSVVRRAADVDVLLITGMRDEAPLAAFSHLVPDCRLVEVYVQASEQNRRSRGGQHNDNGSNETSKGSSSQRNAAALSYRPSLIFDNNIPGSRFVEEFGKERLLPFLHHDLQNLASMVTIVPDFPRRGIEFRHILRIPQQEGGLALCVSLLQTHFDWGSVSSIACCEAGGFAFASALALKLELPLWLIREAGKLPPPTVSVAKHPSYVSSEASGSAPQRLIELELSNAPAWVEWARVVVVDDVLSTGETLCAVLQLLEKAGVYAENVSVMVVAEFPVHRGRELLRKSGFGRTSVQSLLVFDGL